MKKSLILCLTLLSACGSENKPDSKTANTQNPQTCGGIFYPADPNGSCRIRLVSPAPCEKVDLTAGKFYEFAWTNDGTNCEGPYLISLAVTDGANAQEISEQVNFNGGTVSGSGGVVRVDASDLNGMELKEGIYHWTVASFYGSRPASNPFKLVR